MGFVKRGAAYFALICEVPNLMDGFDSQKYHAFQQQNARTFKGYMESEQKKQFPWVVAAFPSKAWAKRVFPG
ncbi:aminopeptidase T, partial [Staphylococcus aureus]